MKNNISEKWYKKNWVIIAFLVFVFPVGLFLMWRYSSWRKQIKVIVTSAVVALLFVAVILAPPIVTISSALKDIESDAYRLEGTVSPASSIVTVNGDEVDRNGDQFAYATELTEGDNYFTIRAEDGGKVTEKTVMVHRLTQAEIDERNAKNQPNSKTEDQPKQETQPQEVPAAEPEQKPAPKKTTMDELWDALDRASNSRDGYDIKYDKSVGAAQLFFTSNSFWNEKNVVGESYKHFLNFGREIKDIKGVSRIDSWTNTDFTDQYGKTKSETAVRIGMSTAKFKKFNWENLEAQPIHMQLRSEGSLYLHPSLAYSVNLNDVKLFL